MGGGSQNFCVGGCPTPAPLPPWGWDILGVAGSVQKKEIALFCFWGTGWQGGWVGGVQSPPPSPRGGGTFPGPWVFQKSVVGGSLNSPPPPAVVEKNPDWDDALGRQRNTHRGTCRLRTGDGFWGDSPSAHSRDRRIPGPKSFLQMAQKKKKTTAQGLDRGRRGGPVVVEEAVNRKTRKHVIHRGMGEAPGAWGSETSGKALSKGKRGAMTGGPRRSPDNPFD